MNVKNLFGMTISVRKTVNQRHYHFANWFVLSLVY